MNKLSNFIKISELSGEDRTKLKKYWSELWGNEFAKALVTDFEASGDMKKVKANEVGSKRKKYAQNEDVPGMDQVNIPSGGLTTKDLHDKFNEVVFDLMSSGVGVETLKSMIIEAERSFKDNYEFGNPLTAKRK